MCARWKAPMPRWTIPGVTLERSYPGGVTSAGKEESVAALRRGMADSVDGTRRYRFRSRLPAPNILGITTAQNEEQRVAGRFVSIGECMIEMAGGSERQYRMGFAGDTLNTAWYLRALLPSDWQVDYVTALGDDLYSKEMRAFFAEAGIG